MTRMAETKATALELPEDVRVELVERLRAPQGRRAATRQAWIDEGECRMKLVHAGKMRLLDADEVLTDPNYDD